MDRSDGNALFLILIAVALFAALSYAVTQSGRGGGTADKEKAALAAAQMVQYGTQVRTAVQRMILTGTPATSIKFCTTAATSCQFRTPAGICDSGTTCVFAPEGGGVPIIGLPAAAITAADTGANWQFYETGFGASLDGVGTASADAFMNTGNLVSTTVCEEINRKFGLAYDPFAADGDWTGDSLISGYSGEPFFCLLVTAFQLPNYVHALIER